jgi:hypothetical protein
MQEIRKHYSHNRKFLLTCVVARNIQLSHVRQLSTETFSLHKIIQSKHFPCIKPSYPETTSLSGHVLGRLKQNLEHERGDLRGNIVSIVASSFLFFLREGMERERGNT